ncbi:hypothetical protein [Micromonospora sicca]|uniref:Polymorphic outer membrane protein repeat-containing protein n=1 Tax=Micromonospora sicca TaxID=2202420 RepID=A0ABU5JKW9_9ACTN|nr:hypothetical protein [Micromonospora sp. 4G53]MDZ5493260.1 hypothetical protein [Micromonospora sp. 4G53]
MSNYLRNNSDATRETVSPIRRRRVWLATGVVGLTGAVSLAGVAYATTGVTGPHRLADVKWSTAQQLTKDDGQGEEEARDEKGHEGEDRGDWDDHGRVREVPCDEEELIEAVDQANRDQGGTLKLAEHCTYELSFSDKKDLAGLPTIKQDITIKGNDSTIKRDSEDAFRIFRVADGGDLTLKDLTVKGGNASEFKYGSGPSSGSQGSDWQGSDWQGSGSQGAPGGAPGAAGAPGAQGAPSGAPGAAGAPSGAPGAAGAPAAQGGPGMQMAPAAQTGAAVQAAPVALAAPAAPAAQGSGPGSGSQGSGSWSGDKDKKDDRKKDDRKKDGEGDGGALLVERGGSAHLKNVKLTGNNAENNGGAIANFGRVDIEDSKVENNHAQEDGGGIFNRGTLKVKDTHISNNTAGKNGGGIANGNGKHDDHDKNDHDKNGYDNSTYHNGGYDNGGYDNNGHDKDRKDRDEAGTVEITGSAKGKDEVKSTIDNNKAGKNGGGLSSSGGTVTITLTVIRNNTACESGGGIYALDTDLKLDKVIVAKNHADKDGGGIVNTGGEDKKDWSSNGGDKKDDGDKKDEKKSDATATISDSDIVDNTAGRFGGGIFNGDTDVKIDEGYQDKKDGKDNNATLTLRDTEIKGNTALNGGGIFNNKGTVTLTDTRVTKNTATDPSKNHRVAGGILNNEGTVELDDESTVTDNDPTNCAGTVEDCFN